MLKIVFFKNAEEFGLKSVFQKFRNCKLYLKQEIIWSSKKITITRVVHIVPLTPFSKSMFKSSDYINDFFLFNQPFHWSPVGKARSFIERTFIDSARRNQRGRVTQVPINWYFSYIFWTIDLQSFSHSFSFFLKEKEIVAFSEEIVVASLIYQWFLGVAYIVLKRT